MEKKEAIGYLKVASISCLPVIEIWILVELVRNIGVLLTTSIVLLTTISGLLLVKSYSQKVLPKELFDYKSYTKEGLSKEEFDTLLQEKDEYLVIILISTVLLLTPGLLTDAFGICLLSSEYGKQIAKYTLNFIKNVKVG